MQHSEHPKRYCPTCGMITADGRCWCVKREESEVMIDQEYRHSLARTDHEMDLQRAAELRNEIEMHEAEPWSSRDLRAYVAAQEELDRLEGRDAAQ